MLQQDNDLSRYMDPARTQRYQDMMGRVGAGVGGLFNAYDLYTNWDHMSDAQRGLYLTSTGMQLFRFGTGYNISAQPIPGTNGGLSYGGALSVASAGINVYNLIHNWDDMDTASRVMSGYSTANSVIGAYDTISAFADTVNAGAQGVNAGAQGVNATAQGTNAGAQGAGSAASSGSGGIGGTGVGSPGSTGSYIAMAADAYAGFKGASNDNLTAEEQYQQISKNAGMMVADFFTGGLASLARYLALQTGFGRHVERVADEVMMKLPGNKQIAMGLQKIGVLHGLSTEAKSMKRWAGVAKDNPGWADYYGKAHYEQNEKGEWVKKAKAPTDGTWQTGKYAGEKWTFEKALDRAKDNPDDFRGIYAIASTYGDAWFGYSDEQQREIVRRNIAANNFRPSKGDVIMDDPEKARKIRDEVLAEGGKK